MSTTSTLEEASATTPSPDDSATIMQDLQAFGAAGETLNGWIAGAQALALLQGTLRSGIFDAARTPGTPAEIAAVTGADERRVADVCLALEAHGIFEREGDAYRLSPDFAILASPTALQSLPNTLGMASVITRALTTAASAERAYTALPAEEMLAMARAVSPLPSSPMTRAYVAFLADGLPELKAIAEAGGRWMELGCGAAGGILTLLQLFPKLTTVGVEINAEVLEEAWRRAVALGVADRVEFRHADARDLDDENVFDVVFWSQFFFPAATRADVLAVALRALKPGGYLLMPLLDELPETPEALREPPGRAAAVDRLVFGSWRVPVHSAEGLQAEVEQAGFEFVRIAAFPNTRIMLARAALA